MQYQISQTPYGTFRVWVQHSEKAQILKAVRDTLDILSCWGGADKKSDSYMSWELNPNMVQAVRKYLNSYHIIEDDSRIPEWM